MSELRTKATARGTAIRIVLTHQQVGPQMPENSIRYHRGLIRYETRCPEAAGHSCIVFYPTMDAPLYVRVAEELFPASVLSDLLYDHDMFVERIISVPESDVQAIVDRLNATFDSDPVHLPQQKQPPVIVDLDELLGRVLEYANVQSSEDLFELHEVDGRMLADFDTYTPLLGVCNAVVTLYEGYDRRHYYQGVAYRTPRIYHLIEAQIAATTDEREFILASLQASNNDKVVRDHEVRMEARSRFKYRGITPWVYDGGLMLVLIMRHFGVDMTPPAGWQYREKERQY